MAGRRKVQCGAKTRRGTPCRCKALPNGRCKFHGGMSTGPRTEDGMRRALEALARGRVNRWARYREGVNHGA